MRALSSTVFASPLLAFATVSLSVILQTPALAEKLNVNTDPNPGAVEQPAAIPGAPISLLSGFEASLKGKPASTHSRGKSLVTIDQNQISPPLNEDVPGGTLAPTDPKSRKAFKQSRQASLTEPTSARIEAAEGTQPTEEAIPKGGSVRALIARHAANNNVPFHLADAIIKVESRYNPGARNGVNLGLGQINLRTARGLGYSGGAGGLMNADTNLAYSIKYLGVAYRLAHGDTCGAVMRYQNGTGSTRFTGANRAYCAKVKAHVGSDVASK